MGPLQVKKRDDLFGDLQVAKPQVGNVQIQNAPTALNLRVDPQQYNRAVANQTPVTDSDLLKGVGDFIGSLFSGTRNVIRATDAFTGVYDKKQKEIDDFERANKGKPGVFETVRQMREALQKEYSFAGKQDPTTGKMDYNLTPAENLAKAAGVTLQTASELAPLPIGVAAKGANLATKVAKGAAAGALASSVGSAGAQLTDKGQIDPGATAIDAVTGGVIAGTIPTIGAAIKGVARPRPVVTAKTPSTQIAKTDSPKIEVQPQSPVSGRKVSPKLAVDDQAIPIVSSVERPKVQLRQPEAKVLRDKIATQVVDSPYTNTLVQKGGVVSKEKIRGLAKSVQETSELAPDTKVGVKGTYTPKSNQTLIQGSERLLSKKNGGLSAATKSVDEVLNRPKGKISDQDVSDAIAVAKAHDAKGNYEEAGRILDVLSEHATEQGRQVQAYSLLSNRTPQGMLYQARKTLKKAGVELAPEIEKGLRGRIDSIKALPDGSYERNYAIAGLVQFVREQIPSKWSDKVTGIWKAGLLTGVKTQTGNALSNALNFSVKKISDVPAAGIDILASLFTGKRTKVATIRGVNAGLAEGIKKGLRQFKTGIDETNLTKLKYESPQLNFSKKPLGRAAQAYTDTIFRLMGAGDKPFYYSTLRNNLVDQALVAAKNEKVRDVNTFVKSFLANPPRSAFTVATDAAEKAVFANRTMLGDIGQRIRDVAAKKEVTNLLVNTLLPFVKVPSAVVTRLFDYTPVGAVKTLARNIGRGRFNQRDLAEGLAEAGTGTGVIFIGTMLGNAGLVATDFPKDPKEQQAWALQGKQPNSILIGGQWQSVNYTSPIGQLLITGAQVSDALRQGSDAFQATLAGAAGAARTSLDQSFLQGVSGALDAVNDPQRSLSKFVNSTSGSVVPSIVGDVAKATDPLQRSVEGPIDAIRGRVPGLRQELLPKQDVLGKDLPEKSQGLDTIANPLRPSNAREQDDVAKELVRLQSTKNGVFPTPVKNTISIDNQKYPLTSQQQYEYNKAVGAQAEKIWSKLIADKRYSQLDDAHKAVALQRALADVTAIEKGNLLRTMESSTVSALTKRQLLLANGTPDVDYYLQVKAEAKPKTAKPSVAKRATGGRAGAAKGRSTGSIYKYAVSLNSGGSAARPKVSVKTATGGKPAVKRAAKPKVTSRRSNV